jgi:hypothetical protein
MSRTASAPDSAPVTQVSKRAARQRVPERHKGLFARFVRALARRLSRAAGEDADTSGGRGVLAWLRRHSVLYAWLVMGLVYAEFLGFAQWGGELTGFLIGAAAVWWFSVGKPSVVASTARHLSVLLLSGLTILFLALCALNTFFKSVRPATVHSVQDSLARFRLQLTDWTSFSLAAMLILGTGLLVLAVTWTNLDAARRYKHVQGALGSYQALLLVVCSFVIYAQSPLQHDVHITYDRLSHAYRAAVEQEIKAQSQIDAAPQLRQSLQDLSHNQQQQLSSVLHTIYSDAHGDRYAVSLIESQVFDPSPLLSSAGLPADVVRMPPIDFGQMLEGDVSANASTSVGPLPTTPKQLDDELDVASGAEAAASRISPAAHQAASAVISMLVHIVEYATPLRIPSAAAQMVAENLFENYVDLFEPKVASTLNALGVDRGRVLHVDAKSFLHQGLSASPDAIAQRTPAPGTADAMHAALAQHSDPSDPSDPHAAPSDAPDSVGVLDDLHF